MRASPEGAIQGALRIAARQSSEMPYICYVSTNKIKNRKHFQQNKIKNRKHFQQI